MLIKPLKQLNKAGVYKGGRTGLKTPFISEEFVEIEQTKY